MPSQISHKLLCNGFTVLLVLVGNGCRDWNVWLGSLLFCQVYAFVYKFIKLACISLQIKLKLFSQIKLYYRVFQSIIQDSITNTKIVHIAQKYMYNVYIHFILPRSWDCFHSNSRFIFYVYAIMAQDYVDSAIPINLFKFY